MVFGQNLELPEYKKLTDDKDFVDVSMQILKTLNNPILLNKL